MPGTIDRVRRTIERDGLIPPGSRVLAAVSGGSDSVALLVALADLSHQLGFVLSGLAHLNHHLRGGESDDDERFCRDLATNFGLACHVGHADVLALAKSARVSMEVAARRARYRSFDEAARLFSADLVATGHTRDDLAETLLLNLVRGAGRRGLGGIPPRRGRIVRPLLDVGRRELRDLVASRGLSYREDASNADRAIPRNWIRHELLPLIGARFGRDPLTALGRQARLLRDEDAFLDGLAAEAQPAVVLSLDRVEGRATLDAASLTHLPRAIARRVLRLVALGLGITPSPASAGIEAVLEVAASPASANAADLPGFRVERNGKIVVLRSRPLPRRQSPSAWTYDLPVPGRIEALEHGFALEALEAVEGRQLLQRQMVAADDYTAVIDATCAAGHLRVRTWRRGDALVPLGMGGRKKLQDVFVDRKIPRTWRDRVPVVVNEQDDIIWVAGVVLSEHAKVTDRTQSVVILRLSRLGDWL
jgi:tRNA(Ile)-lysidine synthase